MAAYVSEIDPAFLQLAEAAGYRPRWLVPSAEGVPVASGLSPEGWEQNLSAFFARSEAIADELAT
jgi:hypothetical protein